MDQVDDLSMEWKQHGDIYNNGPDQLISSSAIYTCQVDGAIKLSHLGNESAAVGRKPISLPSLLQRAARRVPNRTALAMKRDGVWQTWTYERLLKDVCTVAKAFIALGVGQHDAVCILGSNSPEWIIADLAVIFAGGVAAGITYTDSATGCAFAVNDSKAQILIVEDEEQLDKILCHKNDLPNLKTIIQYSGAIKTENVHSWNKLVMLGENQADVILEQRLKLIAVNQCCTVVYTSGTTGNPKGAMFSHDNLTWSAQSNCSTLQLRDCIEDFVCFLPLSHVAAQLYVLHMGMTCCASIYIADKNAMKSNLISTLADVQPTMLFSVPRVWEKMYETMVEAEKGSYWWTKIAASWARGKSLEYHSKRMETGENAASLSFNLADKFFLSKVRDSIGLGRCRVHLSGGAPISLEILNYFLSTNIVLTEAYGLTESTGPHCFGVESGFRAGSVGRSMLGVDTRLDKPDAQGHGEICIGGRNICMGYLNQPEKTREAIDTERWLHTGDIGRIDKDGYIFVTGRIKEMLILSRGYNVFPVPIETIVKATLGFVSQAMLVGDKLSCLSVLITLKTEVDKNTMQPLDILEASTRDWINANGNCAVNSVPDVLNELYEKKNQKLSAAIQAKIDEVNSKACSRAEIIEKWHVLPVDFSIAGGEFGPILKVKRATVVQKYQHIIDALYSK